MTVAICLECGKMKAGAWKLCPHCNYQPRGVEALAKSMMVSDQFIASDMLAEFAARRQQGEPFNFEPELVEEFKARLIALIPLTPDGLPDTERVPPIATAQASSLEGTPPCKPWWRFWN